MKKKGLLGRIFGIINKIRGCFVADLPTVTMHPLFLAFCAFLIFTGGVYPVVSSIIAVVIHELGHSFEAYRRGYKLKKITLYPYGGVVDGENVSKEHMVTVAIAGPLANVVVALVCNSFRSVYPEAEFLTSLLNANVAVFAFNLLPAFPLDGARIITSLCKNEIKALKILRIVGIACSLALFIAFIFSAFGKINLTLGVIAIFLLAGSTTGTGREICARVVGLSPLVKNYRNGVEVRRVAVHQNSSLLKVQSMLKARSITEFLLVDDTGVTVDEFSENDLMTMSLSLPSDMPIGRALAKIRT